MDKTKLIKGESVKHVVADHPQMPDLLADGWKPEKVAAPKKSKKATKPKTSKKAK